MTQALLIIHIALALSSIVVAFAGLIVRGAVRSFADRMLKPSATLVGLSGAGLVISGGSFTRACASGVLTLSTMSVLRYLSVKHTYADSQ